MKYILKQKNCTDEEILARSAIQPGMTLYGYCGGVFGRDSYDDKVVVLIQDNTLTVKNEEGHLMSAQVYSWADLIQASNYHLKEQGFEEK